MREAVIFYVLKAKFMQYTGINLCPLCIHKLDQKKPKQKY